MEGRDLAFPSVEGPRDPDTGRSGWEPSFGLTKRELFAAMAMQGMLGSWQPTDDDSRSHIARVAVAQAEALIDAL